VQKYVLALDSHQALLARRDFFPRARSLSLAKFPRAPPPLSHDSSVIDAEVHH
jgi:hypothetical protein